ncbi:MAG: hypothetical protein ACTSWX_00175 [Promethearchaeota archaeon]
MEIMLVFESLFKELIHRCKKFKVTHGYLDLLELIDCNYYKYIVVVKMNLLVEIIG